MLHLRAEHVVDELERGDLAALVGVHGIEDLIQSLVMAIRHPDGARRAVDSPSAPRTERARDYGLLARWAGARRLGGGR